MKGKIMGEKITTKYLLDLVSRSFALAIPLLDKNKKIKVEVQYLLARIIDTIEDSMHEVKDKETLITGFVNILKTGDTKNLENFKKVVISKTINENDKILIENIGVVLKSFYPKPRAIYPYMRCLQNKERDFHCRKETRARIFFFLYSPFLRLLLY